MSRLVTIREAVQELGVSDDTVRRRLHTKTLAGERKETPQGFVWYVELPDSDAEVIAEQAPQTLPQMAPHSLPQDGMGEVITILREQLAVKDEQILSQARLLESQEEMLRETQREHAREVERLHILLQTAQRLIPATAADPVQTHDHVTNDEMAGNARKESPGTVLRDSEVSTERTKFSWWRRVFLGEG